MKQNRKLAQLLFKDNFMFGAVMVNEEICRDFLEMAVGFPIEKVEELTRMMGGQGSLGGYKK